MKAAVNAVLLVEMTAGEMSEDAVRRQISHGAKFIVYPSVGDAPMVISFDVKEGQMHNFRTEEPK